MNSILKFIILGIPYFFMVLGVGIYDRVNPEIGGFPFFYWYQLMWIFIAAGLTFSVYSIENAEKKNSKKVMH
ncbi:MAG: DUF3311 domain-containing protein [Ferroplasma sp.]